MNIKRYTEIILPQFSLQIHLSIFSNELLQLIILAAVELRILKHSVKMNFAWINHKFPFLSLQLHYLGLL